MRRVGLAVGLLVVVGSVGACGGAEDAPIESHPVGLPDAGGGGAAGDASSGGDAGGDAASERAGEGGATNPDASVDGAPDDAAVEEAGGPTDGASPDVSPPDATVLTDGAVSTDAGVTPDADLSPEGGWPGCPGGAAEAVVAHVGQGATLLRGTVVTPDQVFCGEVLVVGDKIACVAASCASEPAAANASVVETNGIIFPGLIDTHNHILFDIFDETHWAPTKSYTNHNQWPSDPRYKAMIDTKQYLNGESSPVNYNCELDKYGELKGLVAGTTSIVGAANPTNKVCYGSLARTIDQTPNGLGADRVQVATLFPTKTAADGVCTNFTASKTDAYLIHIAEGVDATSLNEFAKLGSVSSTTNCLYAPQTTIVHGTALGDAELSTMEQHQMSLVWSPRSNVFLYGAGTDFTKTTNIPLALSKGLDVALAPDWSMGGSQNLLDELRFANLVDDTAWGDVLSPKMLVSMVTENAAKALHLEKVLGSLAPGLMADIMVIGGDASKPYDALLAARPMDVRLVMVGGVSLYGDLALEGLAPTSPGCEKIGFCGAEKFVCVATTGGRPEDKLGQTYAEIASTLTQALTDYDALNLSQWKFSPPTPLVRCP